MLNIAYLVKKFTSASPVDSGQNSHVFSPKTGFHRNVWFGVAPNVAAEACANSNSGCG